MAETVIEQTDWFKLQISCNVYVHCRRITIKVLNDEKHRKQQKEKILQHMYCWSIFNSGFIIFVHFVVPKWIFSTLLEVLTLGCVVF